MRKIILSESGLNILKGEMLTESYCDKVMLVKKYLDQHYMRASYMEGSNEKGIFVKLTSRGIPSKETVWKQDVIDDIEDKYNTLISDKEERDGFFEQLVTDWFNKYKGLENGNLSKYR